MMQIGPVFWIESCMPPPKTRSVRSLLTMAVALILMNVALVAIIALYVPTDRLGGDFVQFWTAATLLSGGHDPYDAPAQTAIQRSVVAWDRAIDGQNLFDFLPYYYPPWLGLACIPLLPLGYLFATVTWVVISFELLILAAWILRTNLPTLPRLVPIVVVLAFQPCLRALAFGQVAPLILFVIAMFWKLCDDRRDTLAGCVLAVATIKPQLTGPLILASLVWSMRQARWGVVKGFVTSLVVFCLASTIAAPNWPIAMLRAPRITPLLTDYYIGVGPTWHALIKVLGLRGWPATAAYLAVAIPMAFAVFKLAWTRSTRIDDLLGLSLIAAFFLAPYARPYDLPVLLVPILLLLATRLKEGAATALVFVMTVVPYLNFIWMCTVHNENDLTKIQPEFTYFWVPLIVGMTWWGSARRIMENLADTCAKKPPMPTGRV